MNASVDDVKEFVAESREAALAMAASHFGTSEGQLETWVIPPSFHVSGLGERTILIAAPRGAERPARPHQVGRDERRPERERPSRDRDRGERRERGERGERGDRDRGGRDHEPRAAATERVTPRVERDTPRESEREPEPASHSGPVGQVGTFIAGILERMKVRDVGVSEAETEDGEIVVTLSGRAITTMAEREPRLIAALSHLAHRAAEALVDDDAAAQVEVRGMRRPAREDSREPRGREGRRDSRKDRGGDRPSRGRDPEDRDIDEAELERLARDAARSVRESGDAELLPPMNSRERWFIHNALKDERGVRSESEGEGARKRVRIFPA